MDNLFVEALTTEMLMEAIAEDQLEKAIEKLSGEFTEEHFLRVMRPWQVRVTANNGSVNTLHFSDGEAARSVYYEFRMFDRVHNKGGTHMVYAFHIPGNAEVTLDTGRTLTATAHPDSKVFIMESSRDCDHCTGVSVMEFVTLENASAWMNDVWEASLEGPGSWDTISRHEFEEFHQQFIDENRPEEDDDHDDFDGEGDANCSACASGHCEDHGVDCVDCQNGQCDVPAHVGEMQVRILN